jgi:hypothetical protein
VAKANSVVNPGIEVEPRTNDRDNSTPYKFVIAIVISGVGAGILMLREVLLLLGAASKVPIGVTAVSIHGLPAT